MPSRSARVLIGLGGVTVIAVAVVLATPDRPIETRPSPTVDARRGADTRLQTATNAPNPALLDIELPAEFDPRESVVSPNGRYVAALARDRGTARLYRLGPLAAGTVTRQLQQVSEVRGYVPYGDVSWLVDSSALLVRSDLIPGHTLKNRVANPALRMVILNTDGTTVIAPSDVTSPLYTSYPQRRTPLSPDGRWLVLNNEECCLSRVRLLARSGLEVKTMVPAPTDGSQVAAIGWDASGHLLYQQTWPDRSVLTALGADGSVRYRVHAPPEFGGAFWSPVAIAPDRSWRTIISGLGIGSGFREFRLLVDSELRRLPSEIEILGYSAFSHSGNELVYRSSTGAMRAYDVRTGVTRTLGLVVAPTALPGGPTTIGPVDRYYVWMEALSGFVGDLESGKTVDLALPNPPFVDRLDGPFLAVYYPNGIVIADLAALLR